MGYFDLLEQHIAKHILYTYRKILHRYLSTTVLLNVVIKPVEMELTEQVLKSRTMEIATEGALCPPWSIATLIVARRASS